MYSSTFIFAKKQYDEKFFRLDEAIADAARKIPGYVGEETWENHAAGLVSNVYYWESIEALRALIKHPKHVEAKKAQGQWLDGYQVIVSKVIRAYGDNKFSHPVGSFDGDTHCSARELRTD
ncbi:MAG TPA: antibiotic biosynthesis monooxygenase [Noviherbaspirillum sp.]|jgi:heme-degrading monooxygenase HmoA|uniref:antibiotic biosynthesis monooxygenase family protein n=1 Tax=Noviherbaspirillum sp. TaxID=1926288 RepID=UPI002F9222F2